MIGKPSRFADPHQPPTKALTLQPHDLDAAAVSKRYQNALARATRADIGQPTLGAARQRSASERFQPLTAADEPADYPTASDGLGCPSALHPYRDVIGLWLRDPLDPENLAHLQSLCGGKLGHRIRRPRFRRDDRPDLEFGQRLTLRQPTAAALEYFAERNDVLLVYSELALDRIYASRDDQQAALQFVIEHALLKDRRGQFMRVCLGPKGLTLYSGQRGSKHLAVTYADKKSKVAKSAIPPLHEERRTQGPQAHRRKGISSLTDLLHLNRHKP